MVFGRRSTAEGVTDGLDLSGKVAVITGVNSGLGQESMRVLALRGAHVIGLARTLEKASNACAGVKGKTTPVACELSDLDSVLNAARTINALDTPIDMLITNAGIMAPRELSLVNGVEMQFATNHLGHFVLVNHLLRKVKLSRNGRVVILSSAAHTMPVSGGIDFDNLDASKGYSPWRFYGQSKLANLLHARQLAKRLVGSRATANAVHPGVIRTNLGRESGGFLMSAMGILSRPIQKTVEQGAATQCFVACHPSVAGVTGAYFSNCRQAASSAWGRDDELSEQLWRRSQQLAAGYLV